MHLPEHGYKLMWPCHFFFWVQGPVQYNQRGVLCFHIGWNTWKFYPLLLILHAAKLTLLLLMTTVSSCMLPFHKPHWANRKSRYKWTSLLQQLLSQHSLKSHSTNQNHLSHLITYSDFNLREIKPHSLVLVSLFTKHGKRKPQTTENVTKFNQATSLNL